MSSSIRLQISIALALLGGSVVAQINVPSNGSSGVFSPSGSTYEVDLSQAKTGPWNDPEAGTTGVYDPSKWAIVFHFTEVNIPAGTTVTFKNHPKNPPVVWLVSGNVTINGNVHLDGAAGTPASAQIASAGPGGFRGGAGFVGGGLGSGGGFGPGGGRSPSQFVGGSYGSLGNNTGPTYNNPRVLPLMGGSGGAGRNDSDNSGGGGGGAILIAASGTLSVNGLLTANGGSRWDRSGGGSGGGIRLIANAFTGGAAGRVNAIGGDSTGGQGRIAIESNSFTFQGSVNPVGYTNPDPIVDAQIWPAVEAPRIRVFSVGGNPVPLDPESSFVNTDLTLDTTQPVEVIVEAENVPLDWVVQVRRVGRASEDVYVDCTLMEGSTAVLSRWRAMMNFGVGGHAVIARAYKPQS